MNNIEEINAEIRRIQGRKAYHRNLSRFGNVESRERYKAILEYEKELKSKKQELKKKQL